MSEEQDEYQAEPGTETTPGSRPLWPPQSTPMPETGKSQTEPADADKPKKPRKARGPNKAKQAEPAPASEEVMELKAKLKEHEFTISVLERRVDKLKGMLTDFLEDL